MEKEEFIEKLLKHLGFTYVAPGQSTYEFVFERLNIFFEKYNALLSREDSAFRVSVEDGYNYGLSVAKQNIENNYIRIDKLKDMTLSEISSLIGGD